MNGTEVLDVEVVFGRYYDPTTGQFLSVDPLVDVTGQPYAYAGDDPVNNSDPTGLAPYNYTYGLGLNNVDPSVLLNFLYENCSWVFPLSGCASNFQEGQKLPLQLHLGITESLPVRVVNITSTSFTFVALPGHPEGAGRTITFRIEYGNDCNDLLNVSTSSNGSLLTKPPLDLLDFPIAHGTWQLLANGLAYAYETHPNAGSPVIA